MCFSDKQACLEYVSRPVFDVESDFLDQNNP
jgi:hypothetical protein